MDWVQDSASSSLVITKISTYPDAQLELYTLRQDGSANYDIKSPEKGELERKAI